jgi:hypothetical protein
MKAREQLDELSQRDALATTPGDRKLHAMSLLAVDQLAIAARKKKQSTPHNARLRHPSSDRDIARVLCSLVI